MATTIILVTGGNSGIGFATTQALVDAADTHHVILAGRTLGKAEAAVKEIEKESIKGTVSTLQLDVTDEASVKAAARHVEEKFGRLDVLVNNAGVGGLGIMDVKTSFQLCLNTNVMGPAMVSESFRPLLFKSQNPYSIYVSSGARTLTKNALQQSVGAEHIKGTSAYQVSKAALNMLALLEYRDHGPKGLKVFIVSPGFVRSNLRGPSEEARSGWGKAGDPQDSGKIILDVVQGKRDGDVACLIHKDGVFAW